MEFAVTSAVILIGFLLTLTFHVIEPNEVGVVMRRGRPHRFGGPGLTLIIPLVERVERIPREHLLDAARTTAPAREDSGHNRPVLRR